MITDSLFTLACAGFIGLLFGAGLTFAGYRLFLALLPIWGFFFGFVLGAQAIQALMGVGFLATVTSWVVGFLVAALFAVLSYLFYVVAVAILAGSFGYAISVGLLLAIGMNFGFILWLIGIVVGVAFAFVTIRFNLQKWVIIAATSFLGAGVTFSTIILMFNPVANLMANPVQVFLSQSTFLTILFLVVAILGIVVQVQTTKSLEFEAYNRLSESAV